MGNHFHLLLETPEPNLVAGMKWLLGVFSLGWPVPGDAKGMYSKGATSRCRWRWASREVLSRLQTA